MEPIGNPETSADSYQSTRCNIPEERKPQIFLFSETSRQAVGPTQPFIQLVQGAISLRVERLGREGNHSNRLMSRLQTTGAVHSVQLDFTMTLVRVVTL